MIDTMDKHSCELFLEDALEIGRRLVETGAEVKRVEDTVRRIFFFYVLFAVFIVFYLCVEVILVVVLFIFFLNH